MPSPEENQQLSVQISLAELKQALNYLQRDITDIKSAYVSEVARIKDKVEAHQTALDRLDGSFKIIARSQTILYIVFGAGFVAGIYTALHH